MIREHLERIARHRATLPLLLLLALGVRFIRLDTQELGYDEMLTAFEGNVEMAAATSVATEKDATIVRLKKDLCRAEEPRAALFYQKRATKP